MQVINPNTTVDSIDRVVDEMRQLDLTRRPEWSALEALSQRTELDGIEVDPAGVDVDGRGFQGLMTVFVGLRYGRGRGAIATSDAFNGTFKGHFEGDRPTIDELTVDTSSFAD